MEPTIMEGEEAQLTTNASEWCKSKRKKEGTKNK